MVVEATGSYDVRPGPRPPKAGVSGRTGPPRSSGLTNLERRAKEFDGTLEVLEPTGGGTHLRWTAVARFDR